MAKRPRVHFVPLTDVADEAAGLAALDRLWKAAGLQKKMPTSGLMAIKMHFGDEANDRTVPPSYVRRLGEAVRRAGALPFATDTTTLYSGARGDAVRHLRLAAEHGYTLAALDMPVLMADGLRGQDQVRVPVAGKRFDHCSLASAWAEIQGFVLLSHVTGHCAIGYGGALKNAAMGWASRGGKRMQHSDTRPTVNKKACTGCGTCVERCPVSALTLAKRVPVLDRDACIGCGQCFSVCPVEAVKYDWDCAGEALQEKIAEYATAAIRPKQPHVVCVNFLTRITRQCDCMGGREKARLPDLGIAASTDAVALDVASRALCDRAFGGDFFRSLWPEYDPAIHFRHAESLGLGCQEYELVEI